MVRQLTEEHKREIRNGRLVHNGREVQYALTILDACTIEQTRHLFGKLSAQVRKLNTRLDRATTDSRRNALLRQCRRISDSMDQCTRRIRVLEGLPPVPTQEEIAEARSEMAFSTPEFDPYERIINRMDQHPGFDMQVIAMHPERYTNAQLTNIVALYFDNARDLRRALSLGPNDPNVSPDDMDNYQEDLDSIVASIQRMQALIQQRGSPRAPGPVLNRTPVQPNNHDDITQTFDSYFAEQMRKHAERPPISTDDQFALYYHQDYTTMIQIVREIYDCMEKGDNDLSLPVATPVFIRQPSSLAKKVFVKYARYFDKCCCFQISQEAMLAIISLWRLDQ